MIAMIVQKKILHYRDIYPIKWLIKKQINLLFIFLITILVIACNPVQNPLTETPGSTPSVRVGYLPLLSAYPLYTAVEEGYFKAQGLDVQLRMIKSGPEGNEALAANNIDVAFSILPSLVVARSKGVPDDLVSIFGASIDSAEIKEHRIIVPINSKFSKIKDLRGKKIAVVGYPGRTSDVLELLDYLERNGLNEKDVQLIGMPHADQVTALQSGTVDAAASAEPYITLGLLQTQVKTLKDQDGFYYRNEQTQVTTYLARKSWVKANSNVSKKFIAALTKGLEKSKDQEWLMTKGLPSFNKKNNSNINFVKLTLEQSKKLHLPTVLPSPTEAGLEYVANQLVRYGSLKKAPQEFSSMIYKSTTTSESK
ncbi:hypothetical protein FD724_34295 (plasmid) [Nostoc sp. C057]|uniref:ABC transporter substrate-binding protein n=1 Tax=Nostoc sp. C057 TaxID=2576903 RepID=UPI0015C32636|nr:NrtA/SsuA/CpmA family ABC transporter substrate-binding protein [Nostoc sp. C057]QLE53024.1 hypothetical protein FD724_34295 [Nostoc sp. C057]